MGYCDRQLAHVELARLVIKVVVVIVVVVVVVVVVDVVDCCPSLNSPVDVVNYGSICK